MYGLAVKKFEAGKVVFKEGFPGISAYIVKSGLVEVSKKDRAGKPVQVALLREGEIFGEMALIRGDDRRTATATAISDTELVEITRERFREFLDQSPKIVAVLLNAVVNRLHIATSEVVMSVGSPPGGTVSAPPQLPEPEP
jgi:CRP-like cAMP-binding protein